MATQNQDRLRTHFASLDDTRSAQGAGWDALWASAAFLPWDRGCANPALADLLARPEAPPTSRDANPTPGAPAPGAAAPSVVLPRAVEGEGAKRKRVLVPGCGIGYDVKLFADHGFDAWGLEVSPHAGRAAVGWLAGKGREGGEGRGRAVCVVGDFFDDAWLEQTGAGEFDIIYDNTVCLSFLLGWLGRLAG